MLQSRHSADCARQAHDTWEVAASNKLRGDVVSPFAHSKCHRNTRSSSTIMRSCLMARAYIACFLSHVKVVPQGFCPTLCLMFLQKTSVQDLRKLTGTVYNLRNMYMSAFVDEMSYLRIHMRFPLAGIILFPLVEDIVHLIRHQSIPVHRYRNAFAAKRDIEMLCRWVDELFHKDILARLA